MTDLDLLDVARPGMLGAKNQKGRRDRLFASSRAGFVRGARYQQLHA